MKVILFDGVCNLCNGLVNWIIDHDHKNKFHFASLQSDYGKLAVKDLSLSKNYLDTIIFLDEGEVFTKSTAALRILKYLGGVYRLMYLLILFPQFIRDAVYAYIATNRYKWFGKRETCRMPEPFLKEKFIQ